MAPEINNGRVMQIATVSEDGPWICSVFFVLYEGCFYWLSLPRRRHSIELLQRSRVAVAVVLHDTQPVVGIQAEGVAEKEDDMAVVESIMALYVEKYGEGGEFVDRLKAGINKHCLYRFTPTRATIFDERRSMHQDIVVDGVWL